MKSLIVITLALILSACSQAPVQPTTPTQPLSEESPSWQAFVSAQQAMTHWQAKGKLAIRLPSDSNTAFMTWQQNQRDYTLRLSGPLGQGAITLEGSPQWVTLTDSKGEQATALTAEALMQRTLGWAVPVDSAHWWVKGFPSPDTPYRASFSEVAPAQVRLATLNQDGWEVTFRQYHSDDNGLPRRIILVRNDIKLVLLISDWKDLTTRTDIDFNG